jgi:hypothetical protein
LSATLRAAAEHQLGVDLESVRVHDDPVAHRTAAALGAEAFTHAGHIWMGAGTRPSLAGAAPIAHELVHAARHDPDLLFLRRATFIERRAWVAFFDHYLPRKFLNNYMDDTGTPVVLSAREMADCNPIVDVRRSPGFQSAVAALRASGGGTRLLSFSGWGGALTNGTLGNFTIHYDGTVVVDAGGHWTFSGTMGFEDFWDFDPKPFNSGSGRPVPAEIKVRIAAVGLPGRPFKITSAVVPVSQTSTDPSATWLGGHPTAVGDKGARTATDIAVAGTGGEIAGGAATGGAGVDVGGAVGGETGAQSSEDLNR